MAETSTVTILRNKTVEIEHRVSAFERETEIARKNAIAVQMTLAVFLSDPSAPYHAGAPISLSKLSVNAPSLIRFDGGTDPLAVRLRALRLLAEDGYPVGLTVAPIQPAEDWRIQYDELFSMVAVELARVAHLDLTVELITHRFTPKSKGVLQGWYPGSKLEMDENQRSRKLTKFGSVKHVYPAPIMREMRANITGAVASHLPAARLLYWT